MTGVIDGSYSRDESGENDDCGIFIVHIDVGQNPPFR